MNQLIILLIFIFSSFGLQAQERSYQADVEGMVCAFCAYSVSRELSGLPGVDADSVEVDLDSGTVTFSASRPVDENTLAAIFTNTGFTLAGLSQTDPVLNPNADADYHLALELNISVHDVLAFESVLEAVATEAAKSPSRMVLEAPATFEEVLLKPILMGRRQVMKVRFVPVEDESIQLQLFLEDNSQ